MNILIVYESQFGNTENLARVIGSALEPRHDVELSRAREARSFIGTGIDLLLVGAPTQLHGLRLLVRPFLSSLKGHGFAGVAAAAFDTRLPGPKERTGAAAEGIAKRLTAAGCRLVVPPESFIVEETKGPLAPGEEERARAWAADVVEALAVTNPT